MITKEGSIKIINFMTPGAGVLVLGHGIISHIRKMHYIFKNLLLLWGMIQTNKVHSKMIMEGSTKIVNVMTTMAGVLLLGRDHIDNICSENALFL